MFDKPEGVARGFITHSRVFLHRSHGMAWYGIADLYHPRDHLILPRVVADSQLPTHTRPEKCAPYIHFSCTNTNGFIQGNMLNTPQAVPLICKASVVQVCIFTLIIIFLLYTLVCGRPNTRHRWYISHIPPWWYISHNPPWRLYDIYHHGGI